MAEPRRDFDGIADKIATRLIRAGRAPGRPASRAEADDHARNLTNRPTGWGALTERGGRHGLPARRPRRRLRSRGTRLLLLLKWARATCEHEFDRSSQRSSSGATGTDEPCRDFV